MEGFLSFLVAAVVLLGIAASMFRVVKQTQSIVIERLGRFHKVGKAGIVLVVPILDRVASVVSLKELVADFKPQPVITRDNVTMQIDTVVYYMITDAKLYTYGVERPVSAIENLTATTLRNLVGELDLDDTLTSRDVVNTKMRQILDEATDPWGIKVNRVELKNILPPRDIQDSMEKQMRAERERRETVSRAEGEKRAAILSAEGQKESTILRADASKAAFIAEAQGRAEALRVVYEAHAKGIKMINDAQPSAAYVTLEGFKALERVADGQATKLIIPSELQNVSSLLSVVSTVLKDDAPKTK